MVDEHNQQLTSDTRWHSSHIPRRSVCNIVVPRQLVTAAFTASYQFTYLQLVKTSDWTLNSSQLQSSANTPVGNSNNYNYNYNHHHHHLDKTFLDTP